MKNLYALALSASLSFFVLGCGENIPDENNTQTTKKDNEQIVKNKETQTINNSSASKEANDTNISSNGMENNTSNPSNNDTTELGIENNNTQSDKNDDNVSNQENNSTQKPEEPNSNENPALDNNSSNQNNKDLVTDDDTSSQDDDQNPPDPSDDDQNNDTQEPEKFLLTEDLISGKTLSSQKVIATFNPDGSVSLKIKMMTFKEYKGTWEMDTENENSIKVNVKIFLKYRDAFLHFPTGLNPGDKFTLRVPDMNMEKEYTIDKIE